MKKRFTEEQIALALRQAESGVPWRRSAASFRSSSRASTARNESETQPSRGQFPRKGLKLLRNAAH